MSVLAKLPESHVVSAHGAPVQTLSFGPNGLMATGDTERIARVWRGTEPYLSLDLQTRSDHIRPTERIRGLSFSPDGKLLFTACADLLRAFDTGTGEERWAYRPPRAWGFLIVSPITLTVSGEGDVAVATDGGRLSVWTSSGAMKAHWSDNDSPRQVSFVDANHLVGTDSFSLCVWRASTGRKLCKRRLPERAYGMAVSPDGKRAAVRTIHGVNSIDLETLEHLEDYPSGLGLPLLAFSPDSKRLAVSDLDRVRVFRVGNGLLSELEASTCQIRSMRFSPDGRSLAAGCSDGTLRFWELAA